MFIYKYYGGAEFIYKDYGAPHLISIRAAELRNICRMEILITYQGAEHRNIILILKFFNSAFQQINISQEIGRIV